MMKEKPRSKPRFKVAEPGAERRGRGEPKPFDLGAWNPKTEIGKQVKLGHFNSLDQVLQGGRRILEFQIVDALVPNVENELLIVGQSKGKFGGGAGRIFKQTQKKTKEGNKPSFATCAVVGNKNGLVGIGYGKAKETVPAREKAVRSAKLNIIAIPRGSGDWESGSFLPHTIPYATSGKCGSVEVHFMPAPIGTGLVCHPTCRKILQMAGVRDVWSRTFGNTASKLNLIRACFQALQNLSEMKISEADAKRLHVVVGSIAQKKAETSEEGAQ